MGGVEAGQVLDAGLVGQVVQRDDLEAQLLRALVQRAQDAAADTAIAIERDAKGGVDIGRDSSGKGPVKGANYAGDGPAWEPSATRAARRAPRQQLACRR